MRIVAKTNIAVSKAPGFRWFLVALAGALISAPNGLVVKQTVGDIHPLLMNALRFALITLVCLPFIWRERRLLNRERLEGLLRAGLYITIAVSAFVTAVKMSQASYVAVILLLTPVILLIYSVRLYGERLSRRAVTGITLAATGAAVLVVLPFASEGGTAFYPMATLLAAVNCLSYPLAILQFRKLNEDGLSMVSTIGVSSAVVAALSTIMIIFADVPLTMPNGSQWLRIVYSGLAVALLGRMCKVWGFEHIGAGVTSAVMYLEIFLGILLPILILHEKMSVATVVGGIFVLLGVYVVESHKLLAHKHHHYWRSH